MGARTIAQKCWLIEMAPSERSIDTNIVLGQSLVASNLAHNPPSADDVSSSNGCSCSAGYHYC
jgi:hypothetical protein